jgi:hypothetical protein
MAAKESLNNKSPLLNGLIDIPYYGLISGV